MRTTRRRHASSGRCETSNKWFKILCIVSCVVFVTLPLGVECTTTKCRRVADARTLETARRRLGLPSISPGASNAGYDDDVKTVKRAFRIAALRYHPDKSRSTMREGWSVEDAEREFQSLVDAYEIVLTWTTTPGWTTTCTETGHRHRVWDATMDVVANGWTRVVARVKRVGEKVRAKTKPNAREQRRFVHASKTNDDDEQEDGASETSSKTMTLNIRFRDGDDGSIRDVFSGAISDDTDAADDAYRLATRAFWARAKALLDDDDPDDAYVPDDDENDDVVPIDEEYPARFRSRV
jgi:hypothetical protein